ncbi:MAG: FxsA family protein [Paracoccaceae bacterium]
MWLLIAFIAVPLIEIALFLQVGGLIGTWPTLGLVLLTAVIGHRLMRQQGALAMGDVRRSLSQMQDPTEPLAHGAMILVAGVLLLTPGFFTDAIGISLLLPPVRRAVMREARKRITVARFEMGASGPARPAPEQGDVIDVEFTEVDPPKRPTHTPSGWTKH